MVAAHPLHALLVDADAPEYRLEDFTEGEGEEADGAELQAVGHLLQDDRCLRLDVIQRNARLSGNLDEKCPVFWNNKVTLEKKKGRMC